MAPANGKNHCVRGPKRRRAFYALTSSRRWGRRGRQETEGGSKHDPTSGQHRCALICEARKSHQRDAPRGRKESIKKGSACINACNWSGSNNWGKYSFPILIDRMWRNPQLKSGVPGMFYLGKWLCIFSNPSLIYYPLLIYILLFQTQLFRRVMQKKASSNLKSLRQHLRMKGRPTRLRVRARWSPSKSSRMSSGRMMKM